MVSKSIPVAILERSKEHLESEINNITRQITELTISIDQLRVDKRLAENRLNEINKGIAKLNGDNNETSDKI